MIVVTDDISDAVDDADHEFTAKFGTKKRTADVTIWEDGECQIEVFHTLEPERRIAGKQLRRRLSTLRESNGTIIHREYMVCDGQKVGDTYVHD